MKDFLAGYLSVRPLSDNERETFGVVWAVYYADKLSHYVGVERMKDASFSHWDFEGEIRRLSQKIDEIGSLL